MPLLKGAAGKATPRKALAYITRADKARFVDVQNLFEDEDYAEQFRQTAARFGKYTDYGERKYYHFKLSPDRADNADPLMVQEYAKACAEKMFEGCECVIATHTAEKMFEGCECVIATHTDTQTVHAHIIVNAVHPITGKKLHFNDGDYTRLKDMANDIGEQFGFSSLDFRKKSENKRTQDERHIILKGGTSWKEELREVIEEGKMLATSEEEFISHLADYGVKIARSGKDYSYLHPQKSKAIRGQKLGDNYTKTEVLRADGCPAATITGNQRGTAAADGKRATQRGIGDIQREVQHLGELAEYAHLGLDGERERDKKRQRQFREEVERERAERSQGDTRDSAGRAEVQSGNNSNHKERDHANSR